MGGVGQFCYVVWARRLAAGVLCWRGAWERGSKDGMSANIIANGDKCSLRAQHLKAVL